MPTIIDNSGKQQTGKFIIGRVYKKDNSPLQDPLHCVYVEGEYLLLNMKNGSFYGVCPASTKDFTEVDCVITISNKQQV